jgi:hypothetical protein
MIRAACLHLSAGSLAWLAAACASVPAADSPATGPIPCNAVLVNAANYSDDLADQREQQMMVMRFASEAAMQAYIGETRRIRMEALRVNEALMEIVARRGGVADYTYIPSSELTADGAAQRIAAADACAAEALK